MENKNHTLKRVVACVMVVIMAVTAVPMSGFVGLELPKWSEMFATKVSALSENGYFYTVENGEATITGCDDSISGDVVIPDTLGGYPVTGIDAYDDYWNNWNGAFEGCTGLTSITFPKSITSIGHEAFRGCTGLTSLTIPESVTSIDTRAFYDCTGLARINWNAKNVGNFKYYDGSSSQYRSSGVFKYAGTESGGIDVIFSNNVEYIPEYAFDGANVKSVTFGDNVTSIGYSAFEDCTSLKSVIIPDSVTSIGEDAFYGCTGLTNVTFSDSIESIGSSAFAGTAWLDTQPYGDVYAGKVYYTYKGTMPENTSIVIKDGTKGVSGYAFIQCDGLTSITIPDSVTSIGDFAFSKCDGLKSVTIPDSITSIGYSVFSHSGLTSITIPDSVTSIGGYAFEYCYFLRTVTIGNSVTSIDDYAFHNCALTNVIIPDSVTNIGYGAFSSCRSLTSVTIGNGVETIKGAYNMGYGTFEGCPLSTIRIGKNVKAIGVIAFSGIKEIPEVYYAGSEEDWKNIAIDQSNDMILRATMYYNADISHTHSYTAKITKKATCTESGVKTFTCDCGKTYTETIPATGHKYATETHAATCTSIGVSIKKCTVCGTVASAKTTSATGHTLKTAVTPATQTESGLSITSCKTCGTITKATLIKRIASVSLSKTAFTYNGKVQTPTVTVKDSSGKVLKNGTDYTVKYSSGRKNPGQYSVTVTFKGNYSGAKTLTYTIAPGTPSLTVTAGSKKATLKWNKQTGATGYVVYMSTSKSGKYTKVATVKGNSAVTYTKTGLTRGKTYYFKVQAYTAAGGKTINGAFSAVKSVKVR